MTRTQGSATATTDKTAGAAGVNRTTIPGPRGLELWRTFFKLRDRPYDCLLDLALRYGDIVLLEYPLDRFVLIAKPEYIEHILHHRHHIYDKQTTRWNSLRQVWGEGLLTSDGDTWRRQRQRMQPAFHQQATQSFAGTVVEEAQRVAGVWAESAARGEPRDVYVDMLSCAMRAVSRAEPQIPALPVRVRHRDRHSA
jgi:cytochrome P450